MYEKGRFICKSLNYVKVDKADRVEQIVGLSKIRS